MFPCLQGSPLLPILWQTKWKNFSVWEILQVNLEIFPHWNLNLSHTVHSKPTSTKQTNVGRVCMRWGSKQRTLMSLKIFFKSQIFGQLWKKLLPGEWSKTLRICDCKDLVQSASEDLPSCKFIYLLIRPPEIFMLCVSRTLQPYCWPKECFFKKIQAVGNSKPWSFRSW